MAYWLFKSEPDAWSWDEQLAAGAKGTEWTGVRNFQARNVMRQMKTGDRGFFYHSGDVRAVVGIVEVIAEVHPDSSADGGDWECVDLAAQKPLARPVTLAEVKATPALAQMALVRNSRLSVQPVTDAEWAELMQLSARSVAAPTTPTPPAAKRVAKAKTAAAPAGAGTGARRAAEKGEDAGREDEGGVTPSPPEAARFVVRNTLRRSPPLVPEIVLHLADEALPLWERTEAELEEQGLPPPYWAFAWAGGQALARHILDHPGLVRGKRVLDLGAGGGIGAIAAARAGAVHVEANEIDAFALAAIGLNAALNEVAVATVADDILGAATAADVVLVGDLFYEKPLAERALAFARRAAARGAKILVGDPRRSYLPADVFVTLATYTVPVPRALEDSDVKRTGVLTFPAARPASA